MTDLIEFIRYDFIMISMKSPPPTKPDAAHRVRPGLSPLHHARQGPPLLCLLSASEEASDGGHVGRAGAREPREARSEARSIPIRETQGLGGVLGGADLSSSLPTRAPQPPTSRRSPP